jgi:Prophage CP4-57 regulatory protein (AlpA)
MTIYRLALAGKFPKRRQLSENSVAWLEADILDWIDSRPIARLRAAAEMSRTVAQRDQLAKFLRVSRGIAAAHLSGGCCRGTLRPRCVGNFRVLSELPRLPCCNPGSH